MSPGTLSVSRGSRIFFIFGGRGKRERNTSNPPALPTENKEKYGCMAGETSLGPRPPPF